MNSAIGGVATAAGIGFQYLATIEALLDRLEATPEDFTLTTEDPRGEILDFSIDIEGEMFLAAQAKAAVDGSDGAIISPQEILSIARRLIAHPSRHFVIVTNRRLSSRATDLLHRCAAIGDDEPSATVRERLGEDLTDSAVATLSQIPDRELLRLRRLRVETHHGTPEEQARRLSERILSLRRRAGRGAGQQTAQVLLSYVVAELLYRSGRRSNRMFTRDTAMSLLGVSERTLAYSADRYDWGIRHGPFPTTPVISRPRHLDGMIDALGALDNRRGSGLLCLTGMSGVGKSSLVSAFAAQMTTRYDSMLWIDADSAATIAHQVTEVLDLEPGLHTTEDLARRFRSALEQSPESWLVVFDNASGATSLRDWIPSHGHVDVIATSTNSSGWPQWRTLPIGALARDEALEMVRNRLDLHHLSPSDRRNAAILVEALDCWPLAIDLACAFLKSSRRGLSLTEDYIERLRSRVLDDAGLMPQDYHSHPTLLQAILIAIDAIETGDEQHRGLRGSALLRTLAYLPPRAAPLELAVQVAVLQEVAEGRPHTEVPASPAEWTLIGDDAVASLNAASLIEVPEGAVRCRTNTIVLDIVRQLQGDVEQALALSLLQNVVGERMRVALDAEEFHDVSALLPSALTVLEHTDLTGGPTPHGILLFGNAAMFLQLRRDLISARALLRHELRLLEDNELLSPILAAKVHTSLAYCELQVSDDGGSLEASISAALRAAQGVLESNPSAMGRLEGSAQQLQEILTALERSTMPVDREALAAWTRDLHELFPGLTDDPVNWRVSRDLDTPGNDDIATLGQIDALLAQASSVLRQIDLLFQRAETLASAGDYPASLEAFTTAVARSRHAALGIDPGWTAILNAWRTATLKHLAEVPGHQRSREFCTAMEALVRDAVPGGDDDRATLSLCRAAAHVRTAPLEIVEPLVSTMRDQDFRDTHLVRDRTAERTAVESCGRIMELRREFGGLPVLPIEAWKAARTSIGIATLVLALPSEILAATCPGSDPTKGTWVFNRSGVGLLLDVGLLWAPVPVTGWIDIDQAPDNDEVLALQEKISGSANQDEIPQAMLTSWPHAPGNTGYKPVEINGVRRLPDD